MDLHATDIKLDVDKHDKHWAKHIRHKAQAAQTRQGKWSVRLGETLHPCENLQEINIDSQAPWQILLLIRSPTRLTCLQKEEATMHAGERRKTVGQETRRQGLRDSQYHEHRDLSGWNVSGHSD